MTYFPLLLIALVLVFFLSSNQKRKRTQEELISSLEPGVLVVTTSGLYGTLVELDGTDALLEIAPDVVVRFARAAIVRVVPHPPADDEHSGTHSDTHSDSGGGPGSDTHGDSDTDAHEGEDPGPSGGVEKSKPPRKEL